MTTVILRSSPETQSGFKAVTLPRFRETRCRRQQLPSLEVSTISEGLEEAHKIVAI
jgi:hypothetical protein